MSRDRPKPDETVTDLEPVAGKPTDTLDAPSEPHLVPPTVPLLDPVPDRPSRTLDEESGPSGEHLQPRRKPSRLDVVAAEPRRPPKRRGPVGSDAFEGAQPSEPSLAPAPGGQQAPADASTLWFWVAVAFLAVVAVVLLVVVFS